MREGPPPESLHNPSVIRRPFRANHCPMDDRRFGDLLERHAGLIHKIANAYCQSPADREDVIQETALQIWRSLPRYDGRCKESTWIYRIALNVAISFYRRERRHREGRVPLDAPAVTLTGPPGTESREDVRLLVRCIEDLGPLEKALVLLYLDGIDHASIADVLGISVSNVGTKLGRIKDKLRVAYEERARTGQTEGAHAAR